MSFSPPAYEYAGRTPMQAVADMTELLGQMVRRCRNVKKFIWTRESFKEVARLADFLREHDFSKNAMETHHNLHTITNIDIDNVYNTCVAFETAWRRDILRRSTTRYLPGEMD